MVLTRFLWQRGGRQVFLSGSFTGWTRHYPMALVDGSLTIFQVWVDLPEGFHEYRFLVDGIWLYDGQQACTADANGTVNNAIFIGPTDVSPAILQEHFIYRSVGLEDNAVAGNVASLSSHMLSEPILQTSDADVEAMRHVVCQLMSSQTAYDLLPVSSKACLIDHEMPVKQAFHIMYELQGLASVPLWDERRGIITGMLTASDFILILRELQSKAEMLTDGKLEMHTVAAWKDGKAQQRCNGPLGMQIRPLIHVLDNECLKDVALKILQNDISTAPIFSSSQDPSCTFILNLACLPGILKSVCQNFRESVASCPLLQQPIYRIPIGSWSLESGRGNQRQLVTVSHRAPLNSTLGLLLEARISSVPVVDDNGCLVDLYSRSDIMALAKDDLYAHIQLDQMAMESALNQVYQSNIGRRPCHTCMRSSPFREVLERLCDPVVRRLVIIDPRSRRVEGIISLRDIFQFFLGF